LNLYEIDVIHLVMYELLFDYALSMKNICCNRDLPTSMMV